MTPELMTLARVSIMKVQRHRKQHKRCQHGAPMSGDLRWCDVHERWCRSDTARAGLLDDQQPAAAPPPPSKNFALPPFRRFNHNVVITWLMTVHPNPNPNPNPNPDPDPDRHARLSPVATRTPHREQWSATVATAPALLRHCTCASCYTTRVPFHAVSA